MTADLKAGALHGINRRQHFAPLFARDISRWLKSPKDGAELGRSWF